MNTKLTHDHAQEALDKIQESLDKAVEKRDDAWRALEEQGVHGASFEYSDPEKEKAEKIWEDLEVEHDKASRAVDDIAESIVSFATSKCGIEID